jgi:RHS repeat-associated protein
MPKTGLGSSRVVVQSTGTLCYDADFTPFGGERSYTSTCAQNYKFEGKERDTETQNDNFGARSYSWRFGRWLSSDWSALPVPVPYANLANPQTLNLYSMVADDPESFADLNGHMFWAPYLSNMSDPINISALVGDAAGPSELSTGLNYFGNADPQVSRAQNLIIVGDPGLGEHNQGGNFERAAQTRADELKKKGQKVTVVRASSVDDVAAALKNNGKLSGVEYFGHASWDRLYVGETSAQGTNIDSSNVGKLSGANLTANATVTIHACFAGSGGSDSIASKISSQLGRNVTAYDGPTIFSGNPRGPGSGRYPPSSGPLYLVPDRGTKLVTFP